MKRVKSLFLLIAFIPFVLQAQEITYSKPKNEENRDMSFEILGKIGGNYVVYKNIRWKHVLTFYDKDMQVVKDHRIDFVPDRTFNMDIVLNPENFMLVYQYQKNSVVYCRAVMLDSLGEKIGEPVTIDTTRLSILSDNKIYNMVASQDKQHVLVYKMYKNRGKLNVVTKTFDHSFLMTDSSRDLFEYNERRDVYSDVVLANDGKTFYTRGVKRGNRENIADLTIIARTPGEQSIQVPVNLQDRYLINISGKYDNINNQFLINSLYSDESSYRTQGLFSAVISGNDPQKLRTVFNIFPDNLRSRISGTGQLRFAFDDLEIQESIIKRDGGFVLVAEDQTTQTREGNPYNRYYSPYSPYNDYYLYNPGYYRYYSPYGYGRYPYYNQQTSIRFYYDDILIVSVDEDLKLQWSSIIPKQQSDDDTNNFLSFGVMNTGGEIHFIYTEKDNNREVLSNDGLFPNGEVKRYPTLKSRQKGYDFMPKFAKQVGYNVLIVPCMYRGRIAFAKVVF